MLCILYFITVPGVYKLNKTLPAAACFPVPDQQKGPVTPSSCLATICIWVRLHTFVISFQEGIV